MKCSMRTYDAQEVDVVLERRGGDVVGIEIKASSNPGDRALIGMRKLKELAGKRFRCGLVLYTGERVIPAEVGVWFVPISVLWE